MKRFIAHNRNRIWMKALTSSGIIGLFLYIIIRAFSYDFPISWKEEFSLFFKIVFTACFLVVLATTISAFIYKAFLRIKRNK